MPEIILLFLLALLPVLILGFYTYSKDRSKEPKRLLLKLFIGGFGSVVLTLIISLIFKIVFPIFNGEPTSFGMLGLFLYTFINVAFVEEISKFIIAYKIGYNNKEYDQLYDMIVYTVFVTLGFAWIENLLYVYDGGVSTAIIRMLFAVPGHAADAVFMGYYLSFAKLADVNKNKKLKKKYVFLSIFIPTILHGTYDFLIYSQNGLLILFFFVFTLILFIIARKKLKQMAGMRTVLIKKYCSNCGTYVENSNFCHNCGNQIIQ